MSDTRTEILEWIEQGRLQTEALPTALRLAGLHPDRKDWREFFNQLTLWLGAICCATAVIFFFAYNWQAMGLFAKFGLVEVLIIASLVLYWRFDINHIAGQATLLFDTLLVGALLALVGQTYQTGADTYELFTVWAITVFPWVAVCCFAPLWLFWLGLINMAAVLYYQTFGGLFGWLFDSDQIMWALFILNTLALCVWETAALLGVSWLRERWSVRLLAVASGSLISILATWAILDFDEHSGITALLVYLVWMVVAYLFYRHLSKDVFVLAAGMLSAIIVITVYLSKQMLKHDEGGAFLFIGLIIIGLSAVGGFWLKSVGNEEQT
ncbi:MAG: DUF2157 domain-containing protein [Methylococcales bacterium]